MSKTARWLAGLGLCLLAGTSAAASLPRSEAVPGGIAIVALGEAEGTAPVVHYQGKRVMVLQAEGQWQAVIGIPLTAKPGRHTLRIGKRSTSFEIKTKTYEEQHLTVQNKRMVNPTTEDLKRIQHDQQISAQAYSNFRLQENIPTRFALPLEGRLSSTFGLKRFFNGEARNPHSGLDLAAPTGTPVAAPASGRISATGDFFFNGNTIFLDHGQGLVSMFCHLDSIAVKPGQPIRAGDIIGTVGMTGRVTGPHLHWSVSLNDSRVDPLLLLSNEIVAQLTQ